MPNEDTTKAADSLICKLCSTAYNTVDKKPRCFMPCGHTFCEKCISELLERLCPQCKKPYNQAIVDFDCIDLGRVDICWLTVNRLCIFFSIYLINIIECLNII